MEKSSGSIGALVAMFIFSWPLVLLYVLVFSGAYLLIGAVTSRLIKWKSGITFESVEFIVIGICQVFVFSLFAYLTWKQVFAHDKISRALLAWMPDIHQENGYAILLSFPAFALSWCSGAYLLKLMSQGKQSFFWYLPVTAIPALISPIFSFPVILIFDFLK